MHTWPPLYTPLYFDVNPVVFVCFKLSLLCAMPQLILHHVHANSISCLNVTYLFPFLPHSDHLEISAEILVSLSLQDGLQSGIIIGQPATQPPNRLP